MVAPFAPYISEEIYRNLTNEESVHISYYPEVNTSLIDNNVEKKMDLVRDLVKLGRASRESVRIKVRQPIGKVIVDGKYEELISDLIPLIKEELNVKEVVFAKDLKEYMKFNLKPNFPVAGPKLGKKIKLFTKALNALDSSEAVNRLENRETIIVDLDGEEFEVTKEFVDIRIESKEGFTVSMENNLFVILDTKLTEDLINEGYAREFISKVQQMRKNNDYEMMDNIKIYFNGDEEITSAIEEFNEYIKSETLAVDIKSVEEEGLEIHNLNDHDTGIRLEKVE